MKAVVILSGGQDSATILALAVLKYGAEEVAAITFDYGQRHAVETTYAKRVAKHFGIENHKILKLDFLKEITTSALIGKKIPIETKPGAKCPTTLVEGRNALFLLNAAIWAKTLGARIIYIGVSEADSSGYPDCRERFITSMEKSLRLSLDFPLEIMTPFMRITKADEWEIADRMGILDFIQKETVTCYNGIPGKGCGKCPACKLRNQGLREYRARC